MDILRSYTRIAKENNIPNIVEECDVMYGRDCEEILEGNRRRM